LYFGITEKTAASSLKWLTKLKGCLVSTNHQIRVSLHCTNNINNNCWKKANTQNLTPPTYAEHAFCGYLSFDCGRKQMELEKKSRYSHDNKKMPPVWYSQKRQKKTAANKENGIGKSKCFKQILKEKKPIIDIIGVFAQVYGKTTR
jgi:hypothetical protein